MVTKVVDPLATFLDTNILVKAALPSAPFHSTVINALRTLSGQGCTLWISRQVLREYLATLSRPQSFSPPLLVTRLIGDIAKFETQFHMAEDGPSVTQNLLELLTTIPTGGKQVHDANIVATMQAHGISRILTHNTADFVRFGGLISLLSI